jgi:hypothetical protein
MQNITELQKEETKKGVLDVDFVVQTKPVRIDYRIVMS